MPRDRDVAAFHERAPRYEHGRLGELHREIADRAADLALAAGAPPQRVLDVGCGTGYLLRSLAARLPEAGRLTGVDPAPGMVGVATAAAGDARIGCAVAVAEHLPFPDGAFDLVVSTTSFDHWSDQRAGLAECARVLAPGGRLVLVDQCSRWLLPTLVGDRRGKARTPRQLVRLLDGAGFSGIRWQRLYAVVIGAATATR
ncbi:MAG: class I SAM-dependent methyltransferase [Acidimicrobiales bacterium]